jgi:hypothetical protein
VELDQARIAICERTWLENLDLALHVMRTHGGRLAVCAVAGILPWAVLNYALLAGSVSELYFEEDWGVVYYWIMILVMVEAPLATAPITLYLGQALFVERPSGRKIAREFLACLPQLIVFQFLLRALLILPIVTWFVPYVLWPYLSEVILLERNRMFGGRGGVSTLARSGALHRGNGGEFLLRGVGAMWLAPLLIVALFTAQGLLLSGLLGFEGGAFAQATAFQGVVWLVTVYFTVARFLCYLDQRIRNEGWEVELSLRAQRQRLVRQIA